MWPIWRVRYIKFVTGDVQVIMISVHIVCSVKIHWVVRLWLEVRSAARHPHKPWYRLRWCSENVLRWIINTKQKRGKERIDNLGGFLQWSHELYMTGLEQQNSWSYLRRWARRYTLSADYWIFLGEKNIRKILILAIWDRWWKPRTFQPHS